MEPDESGFTGDDKVFTELRFIFVNHLNLPECIPIRNWNTEIIIFKNQLFVTQDKLYQLMAHLKNKGVPVDVLGFQAHGNIDNDI